MKFKAVGRYPKRTLAFGGLALVWLAALLVGALPAWQRALSQHREVRRVEAQLSDLDSWTVAGLWLERSLVPRQEAVTPVWDRMFPPDRRCEALFLDLAHLADASGVGSFELHEVKADELTEPVAVPADSTDAGAGAALSAYRVRARFEGDFPGVAGFLGGLGRLQRAVAVHQLEIQPVKGAVQVELELDVYVATPTES